MAKSEKEWEIERAADDLMRAEEVKRKPKLHASALALLKKRQDDLANVINPDDGEAMRAKRRGKKSEPTLR